MKAFTKLVVASAITAILLTVSAFKSNAQELGIRLGNNLGSNLALDGVIPFKQSRIHANLCFSNSIVGGNMGAAALYDFTLKPTKQDGWNMYMGAGPIMRTSNVLELGNSFQFGGAFELGFEHKFENTPIVVAAEWRPTMMLIGSNNYSLTSFGVMARYVF